VFAELSPRAKEYVETGKVVVPVSDRGSLDWIVSKVAGFVREQVGASETDDLALLNGVHRHVDGDRLNEFRVAIIEALGREPDFRRRYYSLAREAIEEIAGTEIAMQKRVNLSIQMPGDASSLLPVHADTWSGDSPYEVVVWLPLVDCHGTKSMYFLPGDAGRLAELNESLFDGRSSSADALFDRIKDDVQWLEVRHGEVLLFDQSLPHGNVVNGTDETRWSMNCRFKGVFTPYGDKKLGEFFEPVALRPCSIRGMSYRLPRIG